jgi:hypothetical protein
MFCLQTLRSVFRQYVLVSDSLLCRQTVSSVFRLTTFCLETVCSSVFRQLFCLQTVCSVFRLYVLSRHYVLSLDSLYCLQTVCSVFKQCVLFSDVFRQSVLSSNSVFCFQIVCFVKFVRELYSADNFPFGTTLLRVDFLPHCLFPKLILTLSLPGCV